MAKIIAPNQQYTGVSASVSFAGGVGYTDNAHLVEWFRSHGYTVEEEKPQKPQKGKPAGNDPPEDGKPAEE